MPGRRRVICDWGAHLFDTAHWANDTERSGPVEVEGTGTNWEGGLFNTVKDYDVTYRYANVVVMTCKPGNPSIKFIGADGWVGNTGWRGPVQASSKAILESKIGPNDMSIGVGRRGPCALSAPIRRSGFEQMRAAEFPVTLGRELRADQVPLVGE